MRTLTSFCIALVVSFCFAGCAKTHLVAPPTPTDTVSNGYVYIGSSDGNLYSFAAGTGTQKWAAKTGGAIVSAPTVVTSVYSNGTVSASTVFVGSSDGNLYAFDALSGVQKWVAKTGGPVVANVLAADGSIFVSSTDGNLYAFGMSNGAKLWSTATNGLVGADLAEADSTIYFSSKDGNVYALDERNGSAEWWIIPGMGASSSPTVFNGDIYVGNYDSNLYTLDASSGITLATDKTGGVVTSTPTAPAYNAMEFVVSSDSSLYELGGNTEWSVNFGFKGSNPTVVNGVCYVGSTDGNVYAFWANNGGGVLWAGQSGGAIVSSPTVAGGVVYVGSNDRELHAFDAVSGIPKWVATTGGAIASSACVVDSMGVVYHPGFSGNQ
jgi:outer membrane protein assembly factor BamB